MRQPLSILLIVLAFTLTGASQQVPLPKKTEADEKLRKAAVEMLRETSLEVGRMRSIENRLSFSAELASLMWFHDEKEARGMYAVALTDFKQLLMQFDGQMNTLDAPVDEDFAPSFLFGGMSRSPVERKFRVAMAVRREITNSLAEHDPELAYAFFYDTIALISNPQFRKETEMSDKYYETQLIKQIAEKNPARAAQFGLASMKEGIEGNHIELLKNIYAKDAEKGAEFGQAILSKIKGDKSTVKEGHIYNSLLSFGSANLDASKKTGGKKAVYSQNDLRDIADQFAQTILEDTDEEAGYSVGEYAGQIEKFSPARALQIRAKFKTAGMYNEMGMAMNTSANAVNSMSNANRTRGLATNSNSAGEVQRLEVERRELENKKMMESVESLSKPLAKEEREKVVAEVRKTITKTPGIDKKIAGLSLLAAQVAKAGDKELADEIMADAARLVNPAPKDYRDFLLTWMLASGYAEANPAKAFPYLEDAISRANETIAAAVKVAEFIDVNEEMISDGEAQVGAFGGSMIRGMTRDLGIANVTLMSLAKADFAKTRVLTNTFDRIEVRILAKMLVLRAILDERAVRPPKIEGGEEEIDH